MKITNKTNLPIPIYNAIKKGWYTEIIEPNTYSATSLLKPNKLYWLEKRYADKLTEDASERIWALMGSVMHNVLERGEDEDSLQECRLFMDVEGGTVHGAFDYFQNHIISDYKFTSVWNVVFKENKIKEWTEQLNLYALLLRHSGFDVNGLQIVAILRDWSKTKAKFGKGYPKEQIQIIPIELWSNARALDFAERKVADKNFYSKKDPNDITECSKRERWESPTVYAVMKVGRKSAVKLHNEIDDAQVQIDLLNKNNSGTYYLETRHGEARRCLEYCPVNKYCNYYINNVK